MTGQLDLLSRSGLKVGLVDDLGTPKFDLSFKDVVEDRCRDCRRAKDAFKLSSDVTALRCPRVELLEIDLGASRSVAGAGDTDLVRFIDDLDEASRRAGGTFSLLMRFLDSRPPTGMRLCLLTLRSASGVIVKVAEPDPVRTRSFADVAMFQQISVLILDNGRRCGHKEKSRLLKE